MARPVNEWIGKTESTAAPARVKLRIIDRQGGRCACECGQKLGLAGERIEFDHTVALINGGENREANLRALRSPCHRVKTADDIAEKAKVDRVRKKHLGIAPTKRKMPYRRFDGTAVYPGRDT